MRSLIVATLFVLACGCPGKTFKAPSPMPTAADVVARLEAARAARTSFRSATVMDYWLGKQRAKGTVLVMGTSKRQVRFNAVKPDDTVLIDMACDGQSFTYVNFQSNCHLAGPCNKQSVAHLLQVELEPEDFHDLAQGTPPLLANATGTVTWDAKNGHEKVALEGADGKQTITIDAKNGLSDVLASELRDPAGKVVWSVEFTDYRAIKDDKGVTHRVPGKTRFKSPTEGADLIVDWQAEQRAINLALDPAKFTVPIPPGLPECGKSP
jgi:outer membrane lipoprotein-sorting protein